MCYRKCTLSMSALLALSVTTPTWADVLASYEPAEVGCLSVDSPHAAVEWPVTGDSGEAPPATDGDYVLRVCWSGETDRKIELRHDWLCSPFSLDEYSEILVDVYAPTPTDNPNLVGIWDEQCLHSDIPWILGCHVPVAGQWTTASMYIADLPGVKDQPASCIQALVFEQLKADDGCIYLDNLRVARPTISFSGYEWWVKNGCDIGPGEPGYNSFCTEHVRVDPKGLHLTIANRNGEWCSSEVVSKASFGYGTYAFTVQTAISDLDQNAILGLFTYDPNAPDYSEREIDIEFGTWQGEYTENALYAVQPWGPPDKEHRFIVGSSGPTTHVMSWHPDQISFQSYEGEFTPDPLAEDIIDSWVYTGSNIPPPGGENIRMNLWLDEGVDPAGGQDIEVVITDFRYVRDIPTVSGWGMLALGLLILAGGTVAIGRRRPLARP